jgi:hypothetical protein
MRTVGLAARRDRHLPNALDAFRMLVLEQSSFR